jgi:hypothetical protein
MREMSRAIAGGTPVQLNVRMKPAWAFVDDLRRFSEVFCACACPDAERETQVSLAVHELVQNAIENGTGHEIELLLEVTAERNRIEVAVTNACSDEAFDKLAAIVERMNLEPDPLQWYVRSMKENPTSTRGGLGLARIRFESQLDIGVRRLPGGATVRATGKLRQLPPMILGDAE